MAEDGYSFPLCAVKVATFNVVGEKYHDALLSWYFPNVVSIAFFVNFTGSLYHVTRLSNGRITRNFGQS